MSCRNLTKPPSIEALQKQYEQLRNYEYLLLFLVAKQNTNIYVFLSGVFSSCVINLLTGVINYKIESFSHLLFFFLTIVFAIGLAICFWAFTLKTIVIQEKAARDIIARNKTREWSYNDTVSEFFHNISFFRFTFWGSCISGVLTIMSMFICFIINNM